MFRPDREDHVLGPSRPDASNVVSDVKIRYDVAIPGNGADPEAAMAVRNMEPKPPTGSAGVSSSP